MLLALPIAFGVWATKEARGLDAQARQAVALAAAYERGRYAVGQLAAPRADESYSAAARKRLGDADARFRASMRVVRYEGSASDYSISRGMRRMLDDYAGARSKRRKDALAAAMSDRLYESSETYRGVAVENMDGSRRANDLALFSALVLAVLAPLLLRHSASRRRNEREKVATERSLLELAALTDNLTGLRNHRAFQEDFGRELERRNRVGGVLSLMMIDLDGLKEVNDTFGHQAGDERIRALADALRRTMRQSDIAYRVGGDEFTVILPRERAWGAFEFAQRLRAHAASEGVGVAIGITETMTYELKDTVIRRSDLALIEAKRSHRHTIIYSDGLEPKRYSAKATGDHHSKILATALARAVDAKDCNTRNHCETVAELCVRIGTELKLTRERLEKLRVAGLLHDVGKIGIADAILQKPASLDEDETEIMRTHAQIGHNIITAAELHEEADFVLYHHERVDGTGYPGGLAGDQIPLESRIILVADTFEAITSDRPYRRGRSQEDALNELERHAGKQFDPDCVRALRCVLGIEALADAPTATATVTSLRPHRPHVAA